MRLRFRHPYRLGELSVCPALAPKPRLGLGRARAGERDELRPHLGAMHERAARTGLVLEAGPPPPLAAGPPPPPPAPPAPAGPPAAGRCAGARAARAQPDPPR